MRLSLRRPATGNEATVATVLRESASASLPDARPTGEALITATTLEESPVELGIFDWIVTWSDKVASGRSSVRGAPRADHPLIRFGEVFWLDMARAVYEWRGRLMPQRQRACHLFVKHTFGERMPRFSSELESLMSNFDEYLGLTRVRDYLPDDIDCGEYDGATRELCRHTELTLECCLEWAESVDLKLLALECRRALDALQTAV